jgi:hypothetical protein
MKSIVGYLFSRDRQECFRAFVVTGYSGLFVKGKFDSGNGGR